MNVSTAETSNATSLQARQLSTCEAALLLASKQRDKAVSVLRSLTREGAPVVRKRAAECLMEIGGDRALMAIMDLLADPNPTVRRTAIIALGYLRAYSAKPALQKILDADQSVDVRIAAAGVLGRLDDRRGLPMVIKMLDDKNERNRRLAVMALRDIIRQKFALSQEGIEAAKRYLHIKGEELLKGDQL